jgi:EAL domain-containing protein (putative c-di-GMP-specific phosphodiesterase class I)
VVTTAIEHKAVLEPTAALERRGFTVTVVPVKQDGTVSPEAIRAALRPDTVLVSVMSANNETGARQPISESAKTLASHEDVASALLDKLDRAHHTPDQIVIEITETAVATDVTRSIEGMRTLSRAGFPIAIDDFGVGASSFALLKDLPFDFLKLDKSFVVDLEQERVQRLIEAICAMAKVLGGVVVAEGIEELWQLDILRTCGVEIGQGWHIGKPLPLSELPR